MNQEIILLSALMVALLCLLMFVVWSMWRYYRLQKQLQHARQLGHDLRTPLNAILGFSDMMQKQMIGPMPRVYADYAADIHKSAKVLLHVTEALTKDSAHPQ